MSETEQTLDDLERRLSPTMSLGQREVVTVRLRGLTLEPTAQVRAERIAAFVRDLDRRDFGPLRQRLAVGEYRPEEYRAALQTIPHYDLDGWTRRLFDLHEVPDYTVELSSEMVGHITTHAIQIVEMASELGPHDLLYDLGSGTGFVPILASWLSGAKGIGVEIEPAFVQRATERAVALGLGDRVRFIAGDLTDQDYRGATAFFMFYPCRGPMLDAVIARMESAARDRPVKVYSLGLSSPALAQQPWLRVRGQSPSGLVALESVTPPAKKSSRARQKKRA